MKKLFTLLSLALVASLLVSCGGGRDYRNMVPKDAFMVMSANPKAIGTKAQIGDFTQSPIYGHIATAMAKGEDMTPEMREYILSIIAEPSKTGLSMDHDCFMFIKGDNIQSGDFDLGLVFKVHDRKAVDKFADFIIEQTDLEKQDEGGIMFLVDKDSWMTQIIAYNNEAAMVFISSDGYEKTIPAIKNLFAQKKDAGIMARPQIAAILNNNNDMNTIMSYAGLMPMLRQMGMGSEFEWMGKMSIAGPSNFEKGAMVSDYKVIYDDKDAEAKAMELAGVVGKMSGDMLKYLPAGSMAVLGGSIDGAKVYEMLAQMPMYSMAFAMAPQVQPIMEAINGEMLMSFNTMSADGKLPLATVIATVKDESVVGTIRDLAAMGGITLTEIAANEYQGNMQGVTFWFGLKDNMLYISTDAGFIGNLSSGGGETSLHDKYGHLFRDSYGSIAFDIDALRGMMMTMMANNSMPSEVAMAIPYIALFKDFQMRSQTLTEGKMTVNMTDQEKNAAETIYHAIEGLVNMAMAQMHGHAHAHAHAHGCCGEGECCGGGECE